MVLFTDLAVQVPRVVIFEVLMRQSQKLKALKRRRRCGARLRVAGESQAEVTGQVGVSRQTVMRSTCVRQDGGMEAVRRTAHSGRAERLTVAQRTELVRLLKEGAPTAGLPTELWTLPQIAQLIEKRFAVKMVDSSVWRLLGRLGWSMQRPAGQAGERDQRAVRTWTAKGWSEQEKLLRDNTE